MQVPIEDQLSTYRPVVVLATFNTPPPICPHKPSPTHRNPPTGQVVTGTMPQEFSRLGCTLLLALQLECDRLGPRVGS